MIFARKMTEFYIKIARKFFFRILGGGGHVPPALVSYAYASKRVKRAYRFYSHLDLQRFF